ncbi:hypothetical protein V1503_19380 [Bacillus sp. SCS-151]|uniref:hypothetical protein n=1 Tax=Nanhaiella sioensis TaxID=3115293 RepID=UPI00397B4902
MKLLKLADEVYEYYRGNVKGNHNTSFDLARRKITRNVHLAKRLHQNNLFNRLKGIKKYQYGNLHIIVKRDTVIHIVNYKGTTLHNDWNFDKKKYKQLSVELGIY